MYVLTADYKQTTAPEIFTRSLIDTGFAVVKNHPIDFALVSDVYKEWQDFFMSTDKNNYLYDREKQDGFFPFDIAEKAKGHDVKDLKEFFSYYPWGTYPKNFSNRTRDLYDQMSVLAATLLQWIEEHTPEQVRSQLSMPLSEMIKDSPKTMLRILHYPPLSGQEQEGAVRAAPHEDICLLTLLTASTAPGLQVKDLKGNWHAVECDPGTIVVNAGDMLQMCTQNYYRSTTHRVVNPVGELAKQSRLSMPLFLHPHSHVRLSENYTADEYLQERLREIGVK
jgi:isopenicillin N synthase-like dioxygenase